MDDLIRAASSNLVARSGVPGMPCVWSESL